MHIDKCRSASRNRSKTTITLQCCTLCTKSFPSKLALNGHMNYHSIRGEIVSERSLKRGENKKINNSLKIK